MAEKDLENTQKQNYETLRNLFENVKSKFLQALNCARNDPAYFDNNVYKGQDIGFPN